GVTRNFRYTLSMALQLKPFVNKRAFTEIDTAFVRQMLDYVAKQSTRGQLSATPPRRKPIRSYKKSFNSLLTTAGVSSNSDGERRTPYSLRHTYATFRLNNGVHEYHLARNMGTSVA